MATQCRKNGDFIIPAPTHKFLEKLTLTPYKKIYSINDTIWVQFQTTNKSLYDQLSYRLVPTDTTFIKGGFYYYRRYPNDNMQEFFCNVDFESSLNPKFSTLETIYNVLEFSTNCNSNRYFFKVGFIPKKTGIYSIDPYPTVLYCDNKVNREYFTSKFIFDLADCNKDIWLSVPPASRGGDNGYTDGQIDRKEIFMFKVE